MLYMAVALDVSRLSGWLNADSCRFEMWGAYDRGGRDAGRDTQLLGLGQGVGHLKHLLHVRDTGRVETQRLVEHRVLPSRKMGRVRQGGARCGSGHTTAVGMRRAQEHTTNILLMSVTLDVSSVSGWLNAGT